LEVKGDEDEEVEAYTNAMDYDSDSDDGAIMMKKSGLTRKLPIMGKRSRKSPPRAASPERDSIKTIAELPSTTLKYRQDTPEPHASAMTHSGPWSFGTLSPSPSCETLRPSKQSRQILIGQDDEDDDDEEWSPPNNFLTRKDSISVISERLSHLQQPHNSSPTHTSSSSSAMNSGLQLQRAGGEEGELPIGMRRTPSGMFMPYDEEDEDAVVSEGLFGKVVDTVNTAKDIAHVIWNVGWRR